MHDITVRIDNGKDWAEIQQGDKVIRRCHADSELIDALAEIMQASGATIEWTNVKGPRI